MRFVLDGLTSFLAISVFLMWVTGGTLFVLPDAKIEASSLDIWAAILFFLVFIRAKFFRGPGYVLEGVQSGLRKITNEKISKNLTVYLLLLTGGSLFLAHCFRHWSFNTHAYDLVFVHQSLFQVFDFQRCDICLGGSHFGEHLVFSLFSFAPITSWIKSDELLFFFQAALTLLPIWLFLKKGPLSDKISTWAVVCLILLSSRTLRNSIVWDFREDLLAYVFLILSLLCLYRGWVKSYCFALVFAILSKENVAFVSMVIALPILLEKNLSLNPNTRKWLAGFTVFVSLAWIFLAFQVLIPYFNSGQESGNNIVQRFSHFGSTPREILLYLFTTPSAWWDLLVAKVFVVPSVKYLILLIGPYLYFLWRAPLWLIPAVPGLAMNLFSSAGTQRSLEFHYDLIILPFLIVGMIFGFQRYVKIYPTLWGRGLTVGISLALCLSGRWPGWQIQKYFPSKKSFLASQYLNELPDEGILGASLRTMAQLSHVSQLREIKSPALPPPETPDLGLEIYASHNKTDRTRIVGHSALEATRLLLDSRIPWENFLSNTLVHKGWEIASHHPPYLYLKKQGERRIKKD